MTLRKISKKRAERGEKYTLKRSPIKKTARTKEEFSRIYGSRERVLFVKHLPCSVSICSEQLCENAHVGRRSGMGRKGPYVEIAPLCSFHHEAFHRRGRQDFERYYSIDLADAAQQTEQKWQEHLKETA